METLSIFKQLTAELSEGPSPSFNEAQILKTFELLGQNEIGRKQLPERLSLGEGVVRTIIKRFKINGLAVTSRSGTRLTDKGMNVLSDINTYVRSAIIPKTQMTVRSCNYAVLVREKSESIRSGMEQRDHALIAGASGATTIVYKNAGLQMPGYTLEIEPDIGEYIVNQLKPVNGDVIIIGSANTMLKAELGAKAAALKLLWKNAF